MHLCTIREFAFQRDGDGVDIYDDGDPIVFISATGIDFQCAIAPRDTWLLAIIRSLMDKLSAGPMSNAEVLRLIVSEAVYVGIKKSDISANEALREVTHA